MSQMTVFDMYQILGVLCNGRLLFVILERRFINSPSFCFMIPWAFLAVKIGNFLN